MLSLSEATTSDAHTCWQWRNEPAARAASFDTEPIPLTDHERWFQARLSDPHCRMYVVRKDGDAVAWARFTWSSYPRAATIGVVVAPEHRGGGIGSGAISLCCERLSTERDIENVDAFVKAGNEASIRAFQRAGFHIHSSSPTIIVMRNYGLDTN